MINNMQNIHSHESEILQLADLLIGAIGYQHRGLCGNIYQDPRSYGKSRSMLGHNLRSSYSAMGRKIDVFVFSPSEVK